MAPMTQAGKVVLPGGPAQCLTHTGGGKVAIGYLTIPGVCENPGSPLSLC